jgi:hypothetical protein
MPRQVVAQAYAALDADADVPSVLGALERSRTIRRSTTARSSRPSFTWTGSWGSICPVTRPAGRRRRAASMPGSVASIRSVIFGRTASVKRSSATSSPRA